MQNVLFPMNSHLILSHTLQYNYQYLAQMLLLHLLLSFLYMALNFSDK